ncbi:amidohydrolase family protein [Rathayibacter sp. VKM Ac-2804]|uniref:amidohydrolase n=1 Tax=Rathayibacter sp. VKM Ac-2804 TaxID=2609257 RepID=UPI00132E917B|nr:amidohydrolase family protein [Rathayibacter sp. VKM Ac-2804]QHF22900.1 amidohydrolase family protein [Rathayibacter sp. VKM Ac-2804]
MPESQNGVAPYLLVARVRTMDPANPLAEALLIEGDRIAAVGTLQEVRAAAPAGTPEEHLDGTLLPGFIDAHSHAQRAGLKALQLLDAGAGADAFSAAMLADADADPDAPDWLGDTPPTPEDRRAALLRIQPLLHELGFTGVVDPAVTLDELAAYRAAHERGELSLRVVAMPYSELGTEAVPSVDEALAVLDSIDGTTGDGDELLRLGPIKVYYDGEGMKGQALLEQPWPDGGHGVQRIETAEFARLAAECVQRGWGLGVHAVGSRAVAEVLDGLEAAGSPERIAALRCQLIHAYLEPSAESRERAARLGVVASLQPSIAWSNAAGLTARLGARADPVNPMRDWRDSGAVIALGSDAPYFPFDPRQVVATAVTRRMRRRAEPLGTEQALTVLEAVEGYTRGAAHAAFAEDRRGMLRAGFLADLVLLSVDPGERSAEEFAEARVLRTVFGGRTVHDRPAGDAREM